MPGPPDRLLSPRAHRSLARRRAQRARALSRLAVVIALIVVIVALAWWASGSPKPAPSGHATRPPAASGTTSTSAIAAAESGLLPFQLTNPLSRAVLLAGTGNQVVILGGLTVSNTSASGVYTMDTQTGTLTEVATLAAGLHDSAGASLAGRDVLFGGGSPATVAAVQALASPGASGPAAKATATVVAQLPQPRSDSAVVTIGDSAYIVGGYDGTNPDAEVLSTTDGTSFANVAALPVPVRYPAVAAVGSDIYVFGGQAVTPAANPVDDIQMIDTRAHRASVVGHLPEPLEGSAAATLGGHIYLAGGMSSTPQSIAAGVGTTQLGLTGPANAGAGATGAVPDAYFSPGPPTARLTGAVAAGTTTTTTVPQPAQSSNAVGDIWSYDPGTKKLLKAGQLQVPVSHAAATVVGNTMWLVGGEVGAHQVGAVQMVTPNHAFGSAGAPGAGSPYFGDKLLVADRGNNRLLLFDDTNKLLWTYPSATSPPDPLGFYFPDDAFFVKGGTAIITNQEQNETIQEIAYPSGKVVWSYGHPKQPGTAPGYLHEPDDAYLLKNGQVSIADAQNCRVQILNQDGTVAHQIGTDGVCHHNPPTSVGSPNGDTPLADGNILVSEINGSWISEYKPTGELVWTLHLPISYPSDPQQIGPDSYLVADYANPGVLLEFTREGQITYRYQAASGPGMLNHPSLAELLPTGVIMINDDYANRVVAIDPGTGALVWQYGLTDSAGTGPGMLNTPDGFDILAPDGSTPTHLATG